MSDVVAFPPSKPDWLYFVAMRLMVRADRPLADLHAIARQIGLRRSMFMRGSGHAGDLPYYRLTWPMVWRCVDRFGAMASGERAAHAAAEACFRKRAPVPDGCAAKR
jgi:hypothetical protein